MYYTLLLSWEGEDSIGLLLIRGVRRGIGCWRRHGDVADVLDDPLGHLPAQLLLHDVHVARDEPLHRLRQFGADEGGGRRTHLGDGAAVLPVGGVGRRLLEVAAVAAQ